MILSIYNWFVDGDGNDDEKNDSEDEEEKEKKEKEEKAKASKKGLENGIPKDKKAVDLDKDRKKKLMIMGMEAFFFVIQKRNRLQDPKTPRNRWFRWKDKLVSKILIYPNLMFFFNVK